MLSQTTASPGRFSSEESGSDTTHPHRCAALDSANPSALLGGARPTPGRFKIGRGRVCPVKLMSVERSSAGVSRQAWASCTIVAFLACTARLRMRG